MSGEEYEAGKPLTRQLKEYEQAHGGFAATQWLLHELVRIQRESNAKGPGRIDKAEYAGEGFRVTIKLLV